MTREKAEKFVEELRWMMQLHIQNHDASEMHDARETLVSMLTDSDEVKVRNVSEPPGSGIWNPSL